MTTQTLRRWPSGLRLTAWLCAFISPTVYFLFLMIADRFHVPRSLPEGVIASLVYLIPLFALLVCMSIVWRSGTTVPRKMGWMLFTVLAMVIQFCVILTTIVAATGYAQ